jgi:hypothetical protein
MNPRFVQYAFFLLIGSLLCATPVYGSVQFTVTVPGTAGPWQYVSGGLNTAFQYGQDNNSAPAVVSSLNGFLFASGQSLTIQYISGTSTIDTGITPTDAIGRTSTGVNPLPPLNNSPDINGFGFGASKYFNAADYPANYGELVGTFANDAGQIVGTPFNIGDFRTIAIPAGATRLQLSVNDTFFTDNTGSWQIQTSQTVVPEPASLSLLVAGIGACLFRRRRV